MIIICPKCGSSNLTTTTKVFSAEKAVQLYKEQRNISLEESEEYISELEKKPIK